MTDQIHEQISAFLDDELSPAECTFLVRRFERDPELRGQLLRYAAIGSALREELPGTDSSDLRLRIQAALSGREPPAARRPAAARAHRLAWGRPLFGTGIAATVALVAILGLRFANQAQPSLEAADNRVAADSREWMEPESYIVPQDVSERRILAPPIRMTNYLVQHGNYATTLHRTSVSSNVVAVGDPEVASAEVTVGTETP
jgi:negative regulator of sigma E activity